jgi:hypothetical protein
MSEKNRHGSPFGRAVLKARGDTRKEGGAQGPKNLRASVWRPFGLAFWRRYQGWAAKYSRSTFPLP